jgi:hypothetical protein
MNSSVDQIYPNKNEKNFMPKIKGADIDLSISNTTHQLKDP